MVHHDIYSQAAKDQATAATPGENPQGFVCAWYRAVSAGSAHDPGECLDVGWLADAGWWLA